ncbi:hypothetical protein [Mesoplasma melaleucae]|uniref:hypothetical protein n=1 Tax=Mesoplasma melaleucae TaxID=81459 RepID=UPI000B0BE5F8|nr:hypothetical protein [Mesoplasma melaleucae]
MTVEPKESSTIYKGKVSDVIFYTEEFVADDLSAIITNLDLGKLDDEKEATVKAALLSANKELNGDKIKLTITKQTLYFWLETTTL